MKSVTSPYPHLLFLVCILWSSLTRTVSPQEHVNVIQQLSSEIDILEKEKNGLHKELKLYQDQLAQCEQQRKTCEEKLQNCEGTLEELQNSVFGGGSSSSGSDAPTWQDSDASSQSPTEHINEQEEEILSLQAHLTNCEQAKASLQELEKQLEQKQEALRNCQQLGGAAKVAAGAAGLSQFKSMDKNFVFNDLKGFILKSLNEGGFILFKQAAKETIPKIPIVEWEGYSLLDSHELTEITAEVLKAYTHGKNPKELVFTSAQLYTRVKIMEQLDKYGFKKMTDKLEYHTGILVRGVACKVVDYTIAEIIKSVKPD